MRRSMRYAVRDVEGTWEVYEPGPRGVNVIAWTDTREKAHLIAAALEVLPRTLVAMEDWGAGDTESPNLQELFHHLKEIEWRRLGADLRFETFTAWGRAQTLLLAAGVGISVLMLLAFVLEWLARLF